MNINLISCSSFEYIIIADNMHVSKRQHKEYTSQSIQYSTICDIQHDFLNSLFSDINYLCVSRPRFSKTGATQGATYLTLNDIPTF